MENVINGTNLPDKVTFEVMTLKKGTNDDHYQKLLRNWDTLQADTPASVVTPDHVNGRLRFRNKLICKSIVVLGAIVGIIYGLVILI